MVFVTGFDEHALEAFEADALAYLLKPVEASRLQVVLERAGKLCAASDIRALNIRKNLEVGSRVDAQAATNRGEEA